MIRLSLLAALFSPQDGAPHVAETVVVAPRSNATATKTSFSSQVITSEELQATGERSLPRALAKATGLFVQETNLGGGAPILRGLIGNQVLIIVDGVRLNDSTTRGGPNQSLNGIDPATVDRIEVVRGPTSVLYGSDALGGAILIWTKNQAARVRVDPENGPPVLRTGWDAEYHSVTDGWTGSAYGGAAQEHDGWLLIGSLHDWDDLESADGTVDNTGYHGQAWFGSWEHAYTSERSLRVTASRTRDFDVPRTDRLNVGFGQTQPADAENMFRVQDRERYQLTYTDESGGLADSMQARLSLRKYLERRQQRGLTSTSRRLEEDDTETIGLGADWRKALGDSHLLTWGFDVDFDDVDSTRQNVNINTNVVTTAAGAFAPKSQFLSTGVFLQDEILSFEPFDVTAGLRYSYYEFEFEDFGTNVEHDGDFDALTGSLAIARDVAEGVRVTAALGQGFRAPNLADVARTASFAGGTELPNTDLDPEQTFYQELSCELTRPTWNATFGVYHHDLQDSIGRLLVSDPDTIPGNGDEIYQRVNSGDVEYYGAEARGQMRVGEADSPWLAGAYVEYTEGEFKDTLDPTTGLPLSNVPASRVPPLHGNVSLRYEPGFAPEQRASNKLIVSWVELSLFWAATQDELSPFDLTDSRIDNNGTDGWTRLDLDLGGPLGDAKSGASWRLGLQNLTDESYRIHGSGLDAPGFGVVVGVSVRR